MPRHICIVTVSRILANQWYSSEIKPGTSTKSLMKNILASTMNVRILLELRGHSVIRASCCKPSSYRFQFDLNLFQVWPALRLNTSTVWSWVCLMPVIVYSAPLALWVYRKGSHTANLSIWVLNLRVSYFCVIFCKCIPPELYVLSVTSVKTRQMTHSSPVFSSIK